MRIWEQKSVEIGRVCVCSGLSRKLGTKRGGNWYRVIKALVGKLG
jgi:hypothetical protein